MASSQKTMSVQAGNARATVRTTVNDNMPAVPCPDPAGYKYVGARYVPLFADPLEWNNQTTYEPLTVVLHEGNSYTSKTFVPVGVDIENSDYWAMTGNYNAQVEKYRQEVAGYSGKIEAIQQSVSDLETELEPISTENNIDTKELYLVFGDSFSQNANYTGNYWWQYINTATRIPVQCFAVSGGGFISGTTIEQQINNAIASLSEQEIPVESVSKVFVYCGVNDMSRGNATTIRSAYVSAMRKARTAFPRAMAYFLGPTIQKDYLASANFDYVQCSTTEFVYMVNDVNQSNPFIYIDLFHCLFSDDMYDETNHPTAQGQNYIGHYVLQKLFGTVSGLVTLNLRNPSDYTDGVKVLYTMFNGVLEVQVRTNEDYTSGTEFELPNYLQGKYINNVIGYETDGSNYYPIFMTLTGNLTGYKATVHCTQGRDTFFSFTLD